MTIHKNIKTLVAIIFCIVFFPNIALGENTTLTGKEVRSLIEQRTGLVGQYKVFVFDTLFEDRGNLVKREIIKTKNLYNIDYLAYIFDCDDIASFISAHTKLAIAKKCGEGGAIILGTAFVSCGDQYHAFNIFVANGIVYIYDYGANVFADVKRLPKSIKFVLILL